MKKSIIIVICFFLSFFLSEEIRACSMDTDKNLVVVKKLERQRNCNLISISFPKVIKEDEVWSHVDPFLIFYLVKEDKEVFVSILPEKPDGDERLVVNPCISDDLLSQSKIKITYDKAAKPVVKEDGSVVHPVNMCGFKEIKFNILDKLIVDSK